MTEIIKKCSYAQTCKNCKKRLKWNGIEMIDTVAEVVEHNLCCGCGTCVGICPIHAIEIAVLNGIYVPKVNQTKCSHCNLCVECCPGFSVDFEELNQEFFGLEPNDKMLGNYLESYVGYSTDSYIRFNSTSGGIVTQLLIFALENNLIDGVLTTRMNKDKPLEPEAFIAKTKEEVVSAMGSKYCPVSSNIELRKILNETGRFAVVGLPCHLHGIVKAEKALKILKERIVLHIGLLCSHMVNFNGTQFLLDKFHLERELVKEIRYRGQGWPGLMSIKMKNGMIFRLPLVGSWRAYWPIFSSFFFTPIRCTMCPDQAAELADISLGDAWLPEFKSEKRGASILISRTNEGEGLLEKAVSAKAVSLISVNIGKVNQSQYGNLKFKKEDLAYRLRLLNAMGKRTPVFNPRIGDSFSLISALRAFYVYFNIKASANKISYRFLLGFPLPLIRLYYGIYKMLSLI